MDEDDKSSSGGAVTKEETPKQFANAYVAFMVQSGEGLGHGEVAVQDEEVIISSMIAYDAVAWQMLLSMSSDVVSISAGYWWTLVLVVIVALASVVVHRMRCDPCWLMS